MSMRNSSDEWPESGEFAQGSGQHGRSAAQFAGRGLRLSGRADRVQQLAQRAGRLAEIRGALRSVAPHVGVDGFPPPHVGRLIEEHRGFLPADLLAAPVAELDRKSTRL